MTKKEFLVVCSLFLINFVSAYNSFSFQNFFDSLDPANAILGSVFLLSFAMIFLGLTRLEMFGKNRGIASLVSFIVSFLIVYGVHKSGMNYEGFYYDLFSIIGLSEDVASNLIPILILIGMVIIFWKFSFSGLLMAFGGLLFFAGIFSLIYEQLVGIVIGIILFLVGLYFKKKRKSELGSNVTSSGWFKKLFFVIIGVALIGVIIFIGGLFIWVGGVILFILLFSWLIHKFGESGAKKVSVGIGGVKRFGGVGVRGVGKMASNTGKFAKWSTKRPRNAWRTFQEKKKEKERLMQEFYEKERKMKKEKKEEEKKIREAEEEAYKEKKIREAEEAYKEKKIREAEEAYKEKKIREAEEEAYKEKKIREAEEESKKIKKEQLNLIEAIKSSKNSKEINNIINYYKNNKVFSAEVKALANNKYNELIQKEFAMERHARNIRLKKEEEYQKKEYEKFLLLIKNAQNVKQIRPLVNYNGNNVFAKQIRSKAKQKYFKLINKKS